MKYNTRKRKVSKIYEQSESSKNEITKKENKRENNPLDSYVHKAPHVLLDTGWIIPNILRTADEIDITNNSIPITTAFIYTDYGNPIGGLEWRTLSGDGNSGLEGQTLAVPTFVSFAVDLDVPESLLPHVKTSLLIQKTPDLDVAPHPDKRYNVFRKPLLKQLKSDGTLIFKGYELDNPVSLDRFDGNEEEGIEADYSFTLGSKENFIHEDYSAKWYKGKGGNINFINTIQVAKGYEDIVDKGTQHIRQPNTSDLTLLQRLADYTEYSANLGFKSIDPNSGVVTANARKRVYTWFDTGQTTSQGAPIWDYTEDDQGYAMRTFTVGNTGWETTDITNPNNFFEDDYHLISVFSTFGGDLNESPNITWDEFEHAGYYLFYDKGEWFRYPSTARPASEWGWGNLINIPPTITTVTRIMDEEVPLLDFSGDIALDNAEKGTRRESEHKSPIFTQVYQQDDSVLGDADVIPVKGRYKLWTYDKFYFLAKATSNVKRQYQYTYEEWNNNEELVVDITEDKLMDWYQVEVVPSVRLLVSIEPGIYYQEIKKYNDKVDLNGI